MKKLLLISMSLLATCGAFAQITPLWLMNPSISPDGKTIAFGYKGHLYTVNSSGGTAQPLTVGDAYDEMPVWSHDGKSIAFASDRYGDFDVFVISAKGGAAKRLTYYSGNDIPADFSPDDKQVLFLSARNAPAKSVRFSSGLFKNLYSISVNSGRPVLISAAGMERAHYNSSGSQIIFEDVKGYEDAWRKHATSAVTRDVWTFDIASQHYKKISTFIGEDREPVFSNDNKSTFYLSERNGIQNVYEQNLNADAPKQLTSFKNNPVRNLSRSNDNELCFTWNGEIYTLQPNGQPAKVAIQIENAADDDVDKTIGVNGNISEFSVSPNGKEIAFVNRGEIFVTAVSNGETKRITNTPQQERMVQWAPDGRSLIYATERGDSWDIYKTSLVRKDEPYFYASTVLKEEPLIATDKDEFQPKYSPDGKKIAYIEERNILKVYDVATKKTVTILPEGSNHSYSDGDWDFSWSPDSKWIVFDDQHGYFSSSNAAMAKADGSSKIFFPVNSGFGEGNSKWALGGKALLWESDKLGRKSLATQGSRESDVYAVFFDKAAYDEFNLSKEDYALFKERKDTAKADTSKIKPAKDSSKDLQLDLTDLDNRQVRLTINSSSISDYALTKDGSKLYYLAAFEKGFDLWVTEPRTHDTHILAKLSDGGSSLELSKDEKTLFLSTHGGLITVDVSSGRVTPVAINSSMLLDAAAERRYIFEHAWRQVKKKLYDPTLHGIDWDGYYKNYARFLPHINNNYDFQVLLSEFLGELNVSHSGGRYYPQSRGGDQTAALGLLYDETYKGKGLKITEIIAGGPIDLAKSKVKAGDILESIDGQAITDDIDWTSLLNHKIGKNTLLSFSGASGNWEEVIRPISLGEESGLMYKRWTKLMADMVDKLSGGKIGYVHVEGMNDASFRETFDRVMGKERDKKALIVDTRFNGGGWLHDDLATFLTGKNYLKFAPQGNLLKGGEPLNRWQKPSCVLMSEGNYSDAFIFPYVYKEIGIGKLIGMPVAGTGTAVWWERQIDPTIIFGIPMVATIGKENRPTEGLQIEPDIKVPLPYEDFLNGKDDQLEAGVKEMLKEAGN
ncbi:peptidase S41 [Arachidicoccus ginsenosidimutans]|uniref:S41 family peptidase n=1 Tax=Arachidicoccus sp. BS20 TaxID=1850526 RepID=UPI0007F1559E|nr:S41 family peptidase [Arachidicoccus sp. BS20]ANI90008.1 peptidase S41 [Arachidicoccus sp. BS20]